MKIKNNKIFYLIIQFIIIYNIKEISTLKVALIGTGSLNDLYYDYQTNIGLKVLEQQYQSDLITNFFGNVSKDKCQSKVMDLIEKEGYTVILGPSVNHFQCIKTLSQLYINSTSIYFLSSDSTDTGGDRLKIVDFFAEHIHYILGYYAGMVTKTQIVGYISAGPPLFNNYVANAFYVGASRVNPDVHMKYFTLGSWSNPELSKQIVLELLSLGVDIIGQNLEDLSVTLTMLDNNHIALGSNGFNQSKLFGKNIPVSYTLNWTIPFADIIRNAMNNVSIEIKKYNGDTKNFIQFSFDPELNQTIYSELMEEIFLMQSNTRSKTNIACNPFNKYLFKNASTYGGCVVAKLYQEINDPYPDMNLYGNYSIPYKLHLTPKGIIKIFTIVPGVLIVLGMVLSGAVMINRNTLTFRLASPLFCVLIIIGGMFVYSGIIVWIVPVTKFTCNFRLWLVSEGFTILIGSMVVKNFRIWLIFDNPKLKTIKISNFQLFPWIFILLLINTFLMTMISYRGEGKIIDILAVDGIDKYEYIQTCSMNQTGTISLYFLLSYFGILLTVGLFVSWKIRIVDIPELNESKPIANSLYTIAFCLTIIVSLIVSPQTHQNQTIILCISGIFITTSTLFILFIPKLLNLNSHYFIQNRQSVIATLRYISNNPYLQKQLYFMENNKLAQNVFADFTDDSFRNSKASNNTLYDSISESYSNRENNI